MCRFLVLVALALGCQRAIPADDPQVDRSSAAKCRTGHCLMPCATACGGVCVDFARDPRNCGGCGVACASHEACSRGACVLRCPIGELACGGTCADPRQDAQNCGACGVACPAAESCVSGRCALVCPAGQLIC